MVNFGFFADASGAFVPTFRAPLPYSHRTQRDSGCEDSTRCRVQSVPAAFKEPEDALEYVEDVPHGTRGWHIPVRSGDGAAAAAGDEPDAPWLCIRRCPREA